MIFLVIGVVVLGGAHGVLVVVLGVVGVHLMQLVDRLLHQLGRGGRRHRRQHLQLPTRGCVPY